MQHILAAEADGVFFAVRIDDPGLQCQARAAMAILGDPLNSELVYFLGLRSSLL